MKLLKRIVVLLVCFVLLSNSLAADVSAVENNAAGGEASYPLVEDLIEEGFVMDEAGDYVYYGENPPFNYSSFLMSSKNFPDFDIKSLPWLSFPKYVKDIIDLNVVNYMPMYTYETEDDTLCIDTIPFILVRPYADNLVEIYAGYNIGIGRYNDAEGNLNLFSCPDNFASGSMCYTARYDFSGNVVIDWHSLDWKDNFSNKNIGYYMTYAIGNHSRVSDYYFYGGNAIKPGSSSPITSVSIFTVLGDSSSTQIQFYQNTIGFNSGNYWFFQNSYSNAYCTTFTPPTEEELAQETQKGIWDTLKSVLEYIKNLPSNIANSIKGFFTSLGDRISGFFTTLSNSIKGFFTSLGDRISGFFESLKNYLLYFQETKPEHVNPFEGILEGIQSFFDEQITDTEEFKTSLDDTFDDVSGYIETGSSIINNLLNGVPILNAVLIFFLAFAVIRKVVGR